MMVLKVRENEDKVANLGYIVVWLLFFACVRVCMFLFDSGKQEGNLW